MATHLFLSPHPDDVELGCGAYISKLIRKGEQVYVLLVTGEGDLTMVHSKQTVTFSERLFEQKNSLFKLGVPLENLILTSGYVASRFAERPLADLVSELDKVFSEVKPDCIYCPLPAYNQDHTFVYEACLSATRPSKIDKASIYLYEQPIQFHDFLRPTESLGNVYFPVDEDDCINALNALGCFKSQLNGRENSILSVNATRLYLKLRGMEVSMPYAVKMKVYREIKL